MNLAARSNIALGITSEHFADACGLPPHRELGRPGRRCRDRRPVRRPIGGCSSRSPTRCSARRPTPRTCSRSPGCKWDARRPERGPRPARLPRPDRDPHGAGPAAHGRAPTRGVRRPVAARAVADHARRGRGRRARRQPVDRDAAGAGDADARPSAPCSCSATCSTSATTSWPTRSARPRRRFARSRTAPGPTSPPAGRAASRPGRRPGPPSRRSSGPSTPATSSAGRHPRPRRRGPRRRRRHQAGAAAPVMGADKVGRLLGVGLTAARQLGMSAEFADGQRLAGAAHAAGRRARLAC